MLNRVEHEKSFITSGPGSTNLSSYLRDYPGTEEVDLMFFNRYTFLQTPE